jgi:hypothetical protein
MNKKFKIALLPYLFYEGDFEPYLLSEIPNWPHIKVKELDGETIYEPVDTENLEFLAYSDETLAIVCGGDWQEPHTVVIGLVDDQPRVLSYDASDFDDGYTYDFIEGLFDDVHGEYKPPRKTIKELQVELDKAIEEEDYLKAAKLRDEILNYYDEP